MKLKTRNGRLKPTTVRFFAAGGHDAGTGLYNDRPGVSLLVTESQRLYTLLITDGPRQDRPLPALEKLRSPY